MEGTAPTTRCKFRLDEVTLGHSNRPTKMVFTAVYPASDGSDGYAHDENHAFFNATPYGKLELGIQNPHAAELFQGGDYVYIDISKVPALEPAPA